MASKTNVYDDGTASYVVFEGSITSAFFWEVENPTFMGKGHAKLSEPDTYDRTFGERLALARAKARFYRKAEKRAVRSTL